MMAFLASLLIPATPAQIERKSPELLELVHVPEIEDFEERPQWTASPPFEKNGFLDKPLCIQGLYRVIP